MTRRPKKMFSAKHPIKIGTWNVRTLYQSGKSHQVAIEMDRYQFEILGLSEVRWNTSVMTTLTTGHTFIYSGSSDANDIHDKGVGFMLTKKPKRFLLEWNPVSATIIPARFYTKFQKTIIIQVYLPTNNAMEDDKHDFYNSFQATINSIPKRDILMLMGDLNAKVGTDRKGREMGPNGIVEMNENGELFADFCDFYHTKSGKKLHGSHLLEILKTK